MHWFGLSYNDPSFSAQCDITWGRSGLPTLASCLGGFLQARFLEAKNHTLSPIIIEVEPYPKWKDTTIGETHFPVLWLWEEEYLFFFASCIWAILYRIWYSHRNLYLEAVCPLFWGWTLSKKGSFGFQVYTYPVTRENRVRNRSSHRRCCRNSKGKGCWHSEARLHWCNGGFWSQE